MYDRILMYIYKTSTNFSRQYGYLLLQLPENAKKRTLVVKVIIT